MINKLYVVEKVGKSLNYLCDHCGKINIKLSLRKRRLCLISFNTIEFPQLFFYFYFYFVVRK